MGGRHPVPRGEGKGEGERLSPALLASALHPKHLPLPLPQVHEVATLSQGGGCLSHCCTPHRIQPCPGPVVTGLSRVGAGVQSSASLFLMLPLVGRTHTHTHTHGHRHRHTHSTRFSASLRSMHLHSFSGSTLALQVSGCAGFCGDQAGSLIGGFGYNHTSSLLAELYLRHRVSWRHHPENLAQMVFTWVPHSHGFH